MPTLSLLAALLDGAWYDSGYIVPVAGCVMVLGIVLAGIAAGNRAQEMRSRERLECIARGITPPPTVEELAILHGKPSSDRVRRRANIRLAGIVLLASAGGIIAFFLALAIVLQQRDVLCGAAIGLIPLAIGIGFLIDAKIQAREMNETSAAA